MKLFKLSLITFLSLGAAQVAKADYTCEVKDSALRLKLLQLSETDLLDLEAQAMVVIEDNESSQVFKGTVKIFPGRVGKSLLYQVENEDGEKAKVQISEVSTMKPSHCTRAGCSGELFEKKITGSLEYLGKKNAVTCQTLS